MGKIESNLKEIAAQVNACDILWFNYQLEIVFNKAGKVYFAPDCPDIVKNAVQRASSMCYERLGRHLDFVIY